MRHSIIGNINKFYSAVNLFKSRGAEVPVVKVYKFLFLRCFISNVDMINKSLLQIYCPGLSEYKRDSDWQSGLFDSLKLLSTIIALSLIHTFCTSLWHPLRLLNLQCLHQSLLGNRSKGRRFLRFRIHVHVGWRVSSYLLITATPGCVWPPLVANRCRTLVLTEDYGQTACPCIYLRKE
jgi:hypothetical protein